jgi:hypothetical protein
LAVGGAATGSPALRWPLRRLEGGGTLNYITSRVFEFFSGVGASAVMRIDVLQPALEQCSFSKERLRTGIWCRSFCIRLGEISVCLWRHLLGISNLHYQGAKGYIYSTCTWRKYAGNPLTDGKNTIYNIHLTASFSEGDNVVPNWCLQVLPPPSEA